MSWCFVSISHRPKRDLFESIPRKIQKIPVVSTHLPFFVGIPVYHGYHFQTQPGHGISAQELRGAWVEGKLGASRAKGAGVSVYQAWNIPDFPGYTPPFTRDFPASHVSKLGRECFWECLKRFLCRAFEAFKTLKLFSKANWLVAWNIFYFPQYLGIIIIPTDFHIFQRGRHTSN